MSKQASPPLKATSGRRPPRRVSHVQLVHHAHHLPCTPVPRATARPTISPQVRGRAKAPQKAHRRNGTMRYSAARSLCWLQDWLTSDNAGELGLWMLFEIWFQG